MSVDASFEVANAPPIFVELGREPGGKVQLYMRRKNCPPELDDGTCFYCLSHHLEADKQNSLYSKAVKSARELKTLAVTADTFHHTGIFFCGFTSVVKGIARVSLPKVQPNSKYRVAVIFKLMGKKDGRAKTVEDPHPLLETTQLRELAIQRKAAKLSAVIHVAGPSPWGRVCIPSLFSVMIVATHYMEFLSRLTHRPQVNIATPIVIRGVSDPLCSQYIALAHKCGDVFKSFGSCRDEVKSGRMFEALALLGNTPMTKSANKGPLVVDWFDFLILSSFSSALFPRLMQLVNQYHSDGWDQLKLDGRIRTMVRPEFADVPPGSLYKAFAKQQVRGPDLESLVSNSSSTGADKSKAEAKRVHKVALDSEPKVKGGRARDKSADAKRKSERGHSHVASLGLFSDERLKELKETAAADSTSFDESFNLRAGRAVWSMFPLRVQWRVIRYTIGKRDGNELERDLQRAQMSYLDSMPILETKKSNELALLRNRFQALHRYQIRRAHQRAVIEARKKESQQRTHDLLLSLQASEKTLQKTRFKAWKLFARIKRVLELRVKNLGVMQKAFVEKWKQWLKFQSRITIVQLPMPPLMSSKILRVTTMAPNPQYPTAAPVLKSTVIWKAGPHGGHLSLSTANHNPGSMTGYDEHREGLPQRRAISAFSNGAGLAPSAAAKKNRTQQKAATPSFGKKKLPSLSPDRQRELLLNDSQNKNLMLRSAVLFKNNGLPFVRKFCLSDLSQRQMTYTLLQVTELRSLSLTLQKWRTWLKSLKATRADQEAKQAIMYKFLSSMKNGATRHYFRLWHKFVTNPPPKPIPSSSGSILYDANGSFIGGDASIPPRRRGSKNRRVSTQSATSQQNRDRRGGTGEPRGWNVEGGVLRRKSTKDGRTSIAFTEESLSQQNTPQMRMMTRPSDVGLTSPPSIRSFSSDPRKSSTASSLTSSSMSHSNTYNRGSIISLHSSGAGPGGGDDSSNYNSRSNSPSNTVAGSGGGARNPPMPLQDSSSSSNTPNMMMSRSFEEMKARRGGNRERK